MTDLGEYDLLEGFLTESDYKRYAHSMSYSAGCACTDAMVSVVNTLRLADGTLWSIPVTLDVSREDIESKSITPGVRITLRDPRDDEALAIITGTCRRSDGTCKF